MSQSESPVYWSAAQCTRAFARGEMSPVELTRTVLDRMDTLQPVLNAFCHRDDDAAMSMARASEERWRTGQAHGPMDGVCVSIKDLILTAGWPTRYGSLATPAQGPWHQDAPCVARLREAGACQADVRRTSAGVRQAAFR